MAIASRGTERRFTLVEPIAKKASFLRTVARELHLPLTVESVRAEEIDSRETFDLVTSRALASLTELLEIGGRFLTLKGHMLLHKGQTYREETSRAAAHFHFDVVVHPSETDPTGVILEILNLRAKSAG
jgi:16S rRNA (guanine527-N7)-methyltransferase